MIPLALVVALVHPSFLGEAPKAGEPEAKTTAVQIPKPSGPALEGVLHVPAKPSSTIVVLGSGRGYHKDLPLLVRTAEALQKVGVSALRFDWAYFTAKGKHAPDLSTEMLDLEAALTYARGLAGIEHVVLAGKSLGSIAAFMRATQKSEDLAGLILMTFPLHPPGKPDAVFEDNKKIQSWTKPLMIVCGDADPYSALTPLYGFCAGFEEAPRLVIAPGDHSFKGADRENEPQTLANVDLAAHGIARWVEIWVQGFAEDGDEK